VNVDVVIPTKGEWTLPYCVDALKKNVNLNRLIFVAPQSSLNRIKGYADQVIVFNDKNVGKARAIGLEQVETPYYASIDSDVLVTKEWFDWCIKTIQSHNDIAACQGYARNISGTYRKLQRTYILHGGKYGEGFCCLGNTMLKTDVIRKVGMPTIRVEEDWQLRLKLEARGYKWVSNLNIVCPHLRNDVDMWKHAVWWGKMGGDVPLTRCLIRIPYYLTFGAKQRKMCENLFLVSLQLHLIYGKLLGA